MATAIGSSTAKLPLVRTALGVAATTALLIGCSPADRAVDSPATKQSATPKPSSPAAGPSAGWSFVVTRELDSKDAIPVGIDTWGSDLVLNTAVKNPLPEGAVVQALTDQGGLLISQSETSVESGKIELRPAKVSIWSPEGELRLLDNAAGRPGAVRQPTNGQMHGADATWVDTTATNLFEQDWQIRVYAAADQKTRLVADSGQQFPGVKKLRPAPGDTIPAVSDDGIVYWGAAAPDSTAVAGFTGVILARDISGLGPVRTIARHAQRPTVAGTTLYYAHTSDVSPETPEKKLELHVRTSDGHDRILVSAPLAKDQPVLALAATSTHLAWVVGNTDRSAEPSEDPNEGCNDASQYGCTLYVLRLGANQATRIQLHSYSASLTLGGDLLGWGSRGAIGDPGQYVMDLRTGQLWRVGQASRCSDVSIAGPYVSWQTSQLDGCRTVIVRWHTPQ
jgi:hypothetical protein